MDVMTWEPPRSRLRQVAAVLLCLCCGAATYRITVDAVALRRCPERARAQAASSSATPDQRRDGIVMSAVDARETVAMLRQLALLPGDVGEQAQLALDSIGHAVYR